MECKSSHYSINNRFLCFIMWGYIGNHLSPISDLLLSDCNRPGNTLKIDGGRNENSWQLKEQY